MDNLDEMDTLEELAETVEIDVDYNAPYNEDFPNSHAYTITLTYQGRTLETPFYTGRGWEREPESYDVLDCLLSDASVEDYRSFEEWAPDLGYSTDSRKAEKIYHACLETSKKLHHLLGEDFERFRDAER